MEYDTNTMARAKMTNVVVSPKDSREVSAALRGKSVAAGLALLADVKTKKRAIRFTRYNSESAGHRTSVSGPGRYPLKAAMAFEELLGSVRANAEFKDLDPDLLRIVHIKADQAATPFRYGRHRGRQGKRAHIEVIVQEDERLKKTKKSEAQSVSATKQKATSKKAVDDETKPAETTEAKDTAAVPAPKPAAQSKPDEAQTAPKKADTHTDAEQAPKAEPKKDTASKEAASQAEPKETAAAPAPKKTDTPEPKKPAAEPAEPEKGEKEADAPQKAQAPQKDAEKPAERTAPDKDAVEKKADAPKIDEKPDTKGEKQ